MNTTVGNVALAATGGTNSAANIEDMQVKFILDSFIRATQLEEPDKVMEPLIIKRVNARMSQGFADIIELHGFYEKRVVKKAIFTLKDRHLLRNDTITEFVSENGAVTAIRFIKPCIRRMMTLA